MKNDLDLAIQKRVTLEVAKRLAPIVKRYMKQKADFQALLEDMLTLTEGGEPQPYSAPQAKKPRAAISFSEGERTLVFKYLAIGAPATIADVAVHNELSSRLTGAILRDLVKAGRVVEGPKNKFRAVMTEESKDGPDPQEQAR